MKLAIRGNLEVDVVSEQPRLIFSVTVNQITAKDIHMLVLPDDQKVQATVEPVDAKGNPAKIDGDPTWTSSSADIAIVTANPDDGSGKRSAWITPVGALGTCQINVSADADVGQGVQEIKGVLDVQVVAGQAVGFTITTGTPEPITPGTATPAAPAPRR